MTGREHWLTAEALLNACDEQEHQEAADALADLAQVHALLALAAPAYGFHQAARPVVADSPNIVKGKDEGPLFTFDYGVPVVRIPGVCNVPKCEKHG